ncbi:MAG: NADH-quinone oxidoreductase subunit J [Chloroflexi bacterium]|nr:NADH-quinone oxidoreductase subunit J [Chloroflexota bacterium]|tara:strand:- start:9143 stop:9679 length:537 start_codon:yes stop_codon:yes gene_type:complete
MGEKMNSELGIENSMLIEIIFWIISSVSIISALGVVLLQSVFRSALSLIICFITIAAFFILLNAEFLAAIQILVYIGAISVLLIFAILFTRDIDIQNISHKFSYLTAGLVALFCLISIYVFMNIDILHIEKNLESFAYGNSVNEIGQLLVSNFVLPFEVISILLLAALIGAFVLIRED